MEGASPTGQPPLQSLQTKLDVLLVILSDQLNTDNPKIPIGVLIHFLRCFTEAESWGWGPYICLQVHYKTSGKGSLEKSWKEGLGAASLFRVLHIPGIPSQ